MFEENNPPDIDFSIVYQAVQTHIPIIRESEIRFLYHGTHNVYDVKDEYIFRFPGTIFSCEERKQLVQRETTLLRALKPHLSVRIPDPKFVDAASENPHMGYRKLPGASLHRFFDNTSVEKKRHLGETLGHFLGQLHDLNLDELTEGEIESSFSPGGDRDDHRCFFERIQKEVYPNLSESQKEWTEILFHDFLDCDENFDYDPGLVHCDFDTTNILVNPSTLEVTGIIDFEETRMYDPAADFLFQDEGEDFLKAMLKAYPRRIEAQLPHRMSFRLGKCPFIYILSGIDFGLKEMVSYGYRDLNEMIENWQRYSLVLKEIMRYKLA